MLHIISASPNGVRSAASKGFFDRMGKQDTDFVCVQELKCAQDDMTPKFLAPHGYHGVFQHTVKKGCSGAGLYTRHKPDEVIVDFDNGKFGVEGRYVEARYGRLPVISVYMPSSSNDEERQQAKFRFMDLFMEHLRDLRHEKGREVVLCGDVNIVHKEIDIKNWEGDQKNSDCLPEERTWLTKLFNEVGYVDVFRTLNQHPEQYAQWSNHGQAYAENVGWRIDHQITTPGTATTARRASIFKDVRFSDHASLTIGYDMKPHWQAALKALHNAAAETSSSAATMQTSHAGIAYRHCLQPPVLQ